MVVTSSFGAFSPQRSYPGSLESPYPRRIGASDREEVREKANDPLFVYFAAKILAERAAWKFAKENPQVDLATTLPGFVFGPFSRNYPFPSTAEGLGTNTLVYSLMKGEHPVQPPPFFIDVRDVARGHVLALEQPRKPLEEKRFILNYGNYTWKQAAAHLAVVRPQIPVPTQESFPPLPGPASTLDNSRAREVLGIGELIVPETTMEDAVDSLIECQKVWAA
ncbi:hypothetical protein BD779DRAFT_1162179 [Infundibulicybe gibba]|nr:hypothetical protein BD779DRAFT_1162179 [Infundibulicybe gibba]